MKARQNHKHRVAAFNRHLTALHIELDALLIEVTAIEISEVIPPRIVYRPC